MGEAMKTAESAESTVLSTVSGDAMSECHAEMTAVNGFVVRVYCDGRSGDRYDPFERAVTFRLVDSHTVEPVGVDRKVMREHRRAIERCLIEHGYTRILERRGKRGVHVRRLKRIRRGLR